MVLLPAALVAIHESWQNFQITMVFVWCTRTIIRIVEKFGLPADLIGGILSSEPGLPNYNLDPGIPHELQLVCGSFF